jgi:hypothetical protein
MSKTSHDHLFKALLGEFFPEFIDLFFPQVATYLDRQSIEFLPLEIFADVTEGDAFETDLVVKVKFRGSFGVAQSANRASCFIIHVEHQGEFRQGFDRRMFNYFALLHRDYGLPVYPIVIFSHRSPRTVRDRTYTVEFPDWEVLRFNYRVIRLNHLNWQDYVEHRNPVASAFMAKMKIKRRERPEVKLACLQSLVRLRLNPAQLAILSGFIDTYLRLEPSEEQILRTELDKIEESERESVMEIVTSWMERGIEQGLERGIEQGLERGRAREVALVIKILRGKLGSLSSDLEAGVSALSFEQLDALGDALARFDSEADLRSWFEGLDND